MTRIGIILGSTRPNRNGEQVARWVLDIATERIIKLTREWLAELK